VRLDCWEIDVSDPSQTLTSVNVRLSWDTLWEQWHGAWEFERTLVIDFPQGDGMRGVSVKRSLAPSGS